MGVSAKPLTYLEFSAFLFEAEPDLTIRMDKPGMLSIREVDGDTVTYQVGSTVSRRAPSSVQIKTRTSFTSRYGGPFGAFIQEFTAAGGFKATRTITGSPDGQALLVDFHLVSPALKPAVEDIHRVYDRVR